MPGQKKPPLFIHFNVSESSPDYTGVFMENGGKMDAMAVAWQCDFAVSGSKNSTHVALKRNKTTAVELEIPPDMFSMSSDGVVLLPSDFRLNVMTQRIVASINGTLVHSLAGESSACLYHILDGGAHFQMGLTYKTFKGNSSTLAVSGVLIKSTQVGTVVSHQCRFERESESVRASLATAAATSELYVKHGWDIRQAVVYKPSPALSKTVYSEIVGVDARGYNLLHSIMDRQAYMELETLDALFEAAIGCDLSYCKETIRLFTEQTYQPGLGAAKHALTIANATNLIVNVLMSYRADGLSVVLPNGVQFAPVENWNASVPRSCLESNDCDGLSLLAIALIRTAVGLKTQDLNTYPYLKSVRNVVFPHYQVALAVLGATAAEATSADDTHSTIAGHAIAVLVPTVSFLRALERTSGKSIGNLALGSIHFDTGSDVTNTRFSAFFPSDTLSQMPEDEQGLLSDWDSAKDKFKELTMLSIEGTTPADSTLYLPEIAKRHEAMKKAALDRQIFELAAPNALRSLKRLYGGPSGHHIFYSSLLELTFAPDFPLWTSDTLRESNNAATQFVLYNDIESPEITSAGASPMELVMEKYGAFPLVSVGTHAALVLDAAARKAKMDVMPPRVPGPIVLDDYQCQSLNLSNQHIKDLSFHLKRVTEELHEENVEGQHCVAYVCAFNTLVHNPHAVSQFCEKLKSIATQGVVDKTVIPGLACDTNGNDLGLFLIINIYGYVR